MTEPRQLKPATEEEIVKLQAWLDKHKRTPKAEILFTCEDLQSLLDLIAFQRLQIGDMHEESGAYAAGVEDGARAERERIKDIVTAVDTEWAELHAGPEFGTPSASWALKSCQEIHHRIDANSAAVPAAQPPHSG